MSESQNSPPPQLGTNSSSVAIAILVPFFALIFTGFGFYLYKQRFVSDLLLSSLPRVCKSPPLMLHIRGIVSVRRRSLSHGRDTCVFTLLPELPAWRRLVDFNRNQLQFVLLNKPDLNNWPEQGMSFGLG